VRDDVRVAESGTKRRREASREGGVVDDDLGCLPRIDHDLGRSGRAGGSGLGLRDALDRREELFLHLGLVGADGQLELRLVGDDAPFGPRVDRTDRDDCRIERVDLARNDALKGHDGAGGDQDGIDGALRRGPVAAPAEEGDVDGARRGRRRPRRNADTAGGDEVAEVEAHDEVRLREMSEEAVPDHLLGAPKNLFGRLP